MGGLLRLKTAHASPCVSCYNKPETYRRVGVLADHGANHRLVGIALRQNQRKHQLIPNRVSAGPDEMFVVVVVAAVHAWCTVR